MKTNTIQIIATTVTLGVIAGIASIKITSGSATGVAVLIGFLVVATLVAQASADYRRNNRNYNA